MDYGYLLGYVPRSSLSMQVGICRVGAVDRAGRYLRIGSRESRERAVGIEDQGLRIVPEDVKR